MTTTVHVFEKRTIQREATYQLGTIRSAKVCTLQYEDHSQYTINISNPSDYF